MFISLSTQHTKTLRTKGGGILLESGALAPPGANAPCMHEICQVKL
jgi:hypothetical protein